MNNNNLSNFSQNNLTSNNTHGMNFNDSNNGLNNYSNTFPPTTLQNTNYLNALHDHNNDSPTTNNNIFTTHPTVPTPIASDNNVYRHQQPTTNNPSTALPLINSLTVTINSPQTNIIFTQTSLSDMLNQLQQGHNHSPSTDNSQTQSQQ